jgi:hypothetical protein
MLAPSTRTLIAGLAVLVSVATAGPAAADKCTGVKLKALGKKESGLLGCQAKVATKGDPTLEAACDAKVVAKFDKAFAKAGTCGGVDSDCEGIADACRDSIRGALPDGTDSASASKCEGKRLKAAGKKASAKLACYAKAALKDVAVDTACLDKATAKFTAAFNKVTGCSGDEASVEGLVDDGCVSAAVEVDGGGNVTAICPATTTTTTTTTTTPLCTTTSTTLPTCGNNIVDIGEDCDPPGSSCGTAGTCSASCTCGAGPNGYICDFLDPSACLYPFPNDFFTVADGTTDTGLRVNFETAIMPRCVGAAGSSCPTPNGQNMDATPYNLNDGFSPGSMILTRVPGVDLGMTGTAPITDIAQSLDPNTPIVLVNATTLAHHPMFVELDANAATVNQPLPAPDGSRRSLIVRPAVNLDDGTRYIVALRDMKDSCGNVITPNADFLAYRDNIPTGDPVKEARRPHMESLFTTLAAAGVPRANLYLAWDFTVASRRNLSERMLFVRDDGFSRLGANAPAFTVTNVLEHPCTAGSPAYGACATDADCVGGGPGSCNTASTGIDSNIFRRVVGTYDVERYVDSTTPPAKFVLDANGLPIHQATPQPASFVCNIPFAALADDMSPAVPARASIYGHGLLGSNTEVNAGNVEAMGNEHNFVFCATKWIGMSDEDVPNAISILQNLTTFPTLTDRLQQGMLDQLFLARLMIHPNGFTSNAAFQDSAGGAVIDTSDVFYDGNSQGGIFGGTVMAIAQDITRGVIGVPAMNYSILLTRSTDFDAYATFLYPRYPNQLTRPLLLALIQMLWDRSDPSGYAHHITSDPLPGTPAHKVLIHEAFGDHQVANIGTEIEARTLGVSVHQPALAAGRSADVTPFYGIPAIPSYPFDGSALVMWDSGAATPPTTNTPPRPGRCSNDATRECSSSTQCISPGTCANVANGFDPHGDPRSSPDARTQKSEFLKTGGAVVDVCSGAPCTATH